MRSCLKGVYVPGCFSAQKRIQCVFDQSEKSLVSYISEFSLTIPGFGRCLIMRTFVYCYGSAEIIRATEAVRRWKNRCVTQQAVFSWSFMSSSGDKPVMIWTSTCPQEFKVVHAGRVGTLLHVSPSSQWQLHFGIYRQLLWWFICGTSVLGVLPTIYTLSTHAGVVWYDNSRCLFFETLFITRCCDQCWGCSQA